MGNSILHPAGGEELTNLTFDASEAVETGAGEGAQVVFTGALVQTGVGLTLVSICGGPHTDVQLTDCISNMFGL